MECRQCGNKIEKRRNKFCNVSCYAEWQKTADIKRFDIAQYLRENPDVREEANKKKRGKPSWNKGKKLGYIPKTAFKKGEVAGKKHPRWKGGKWLYWRKKCLERDDYTCVVCGLRDEEIMDVDHIKPKGTHPELRLEITNLQTMCPNCHKRKSNRESKITKTRLR